jgi:hypothetical protein
MQIKSVRKELGGRITAICAPAIGNSVYDTERSELADFGFFALQPQSLPHAFPAARFRKKRTTKNATAPLITAATSS